MTHSNVDPDEIAKFEALASRWWDENSEFKPLHDINPLRAGWIDQLYRYCGSGNRACFRTLFEYV